ncbi:MAG: dihydrodipicolinate synthase family protein [Bacilli bacterium]
MIDGVWTALPNTRLWADDAGVLEHTVSNLTAAGIRGLFILGTTGQGCDETISTRMKSAERIVEAAGSGARVVTAVSANAPQDVRELIGHAQDLGVLGVAFTPPFYGSYNDQELGLWLEEVLRDQSLSVEYYLYNIPGVTTNRWNVPLVEFANSLAPIAGIKDSSGNVQQLCDFLEWTSRHGASLMVGDERLGLYGLMMGGTGIVSGLSAAYPKLLCRLHAAAVQRDWDTSVPLQGEVNRRLHELSISASTSRDSVRVLVDWMNQNGVTGRADSRTQGENIG